MKTLFALTSSLNGDTSNSTALVEKFIERWTAANPDGLVTRRDVGRTPLPHLTGTTYSAYFTPADQIEESTRQQLALSDAVIEELEAADVIVIGAPMYNFSIPSGLKSWIDHIARVGRTFRYTDKGPEGLLKDKTVYVFGARGGNYSPDSPAHGMDFVTPYLKTILGFIGLTDVTFIHAEGIAMNNQGIAKAQDTIKTIFDRMAA